MSHFLTAVAAFTTANTLNSLIAYNITRRRVLVFTGMLSSSMAVTAHYFYAIDPLLGCFTATMAGLSSTAQYVIHHGKRKALSSYGFALPPKESAVVNSGVIIGLLYAALSFSWWNYHTKDLTLPDWDWYQRGKKESLQVLEKDITGFIDDEEKLV